MTSHDTRYFRPSRVLLGLTAFMFIGSAHALGLGKLSVLSALDEPLVADIELTNVEPGALDSLVVKLGNAEEFQKAGILRETFLRTMEFSVVEGGEPRIRINTTFPAKEPFLHFLVRATWDDGNLLREYTALLDPPLYAEKQPVVISSPGVVEEARQISEPSESETPPGGGDAATAVADDAVAGQMAPSSFTGAEYGPTGDGDTLWSIASSFDTRGTDLTVFQVMIALLRENPGAFIDNNINRLMKGQILRLADPGAVDPEEARLAYEAQMSDWESTRIEAAEATDVVKVPAEPQAEEAAPAETASADAGAADETAGAADAADDAAAAGQEQGAAEQEDLLKIVRASLEEEFEGTGIESAESDRAAAAEKELGMMQEKLSTLEESLVSSELQNQELRERVSLLEQQVVKAQRLVELESQELAIVQEQAARQQEEKLLLEQQLAELQLTAEQSSTQAEVAAAAPTAAAPAVETAPAAREGGVTPAAAPADTGSQTASAVQEAPAAETSRAEEIALTPETEQQTAASAPEPAAPVADQTNKARVDTREASPSDVMPVSGQPRPKAWWENILDSVTGNSISMIGAVAGLVVLLGGALMYIRRRRSLAEFEESILSGSGLEGQTELTDTAANKNTDTSFLSDFGMAGMGSMQADEVDPLAEAEVYLAYGRDEQAEEVLKEAASRTPERQELKLKLLEIYQQRNDLNSFETLAEELYPAGGQGDQAIWSQVVQMGAKMNPDNPLFSQSGTEALNAAADQSPAEAAVTDETGEAADLTQNPFPQPEETVGIDEEFDRLAEQMGLGDTTADSADKTAEPDAPEEDSEMLDFAGNERSELEFNLDIDGVDEQHEAVSGSDVKADEPVAAQAAAEQAAAENESVSDAGTVPEMHEIDDIALGDLQIDIPGVAGEAASAEFNTVMDDDEQTSRALSGGAAEESAADETLIRLDSVEPTAASSGNGADAEPAEDIVKDVTRNFGVVTGSGDIRSDIEVEAEQWDEAATKLDLAQAYLNMGDKAGARSIIDEVMKEGSPAQRDQAAELQAQIG